MAYIVRLRSTDRIALEADKSKTLEDFTNALRAQVPEGYELTDAVHGAGTGHARSLERSEVTIETQAELWTCAPEGWAPESIRPA